MLIKRILGSASTVFLLKISGALLALVVSVIVTRLMGLEEFGKYAYFITVLAFLVIPVSYGLSDIIARTSAVDDDEVLSKSVTMVLIFVLAYSLFCFVMVSIVGFIFPHTVVLQENNDLLLCIMVLVLGVVTIFKGISRGKGQPVFSQMVEGFYLPLLFLLLIVFAIAIDDFNTSQDSILLRFMALILAALFFIRGVFARGLADSSILKKVHFRDKSVLYPVMTFALLGGMDVINKQVDILLLGAMSTMENVGVYKIAVTFSSLIAFVAVAIQVPLGPEIVRSYKANDLSSFERFMRSLSFIYFLISATIFTIIFFAAEYGFAFLYGNEAVQAYLPLVILAGNTAFMSMFGFVGLILNMCGKERYTLHATVIAAIINIVLNCVLIPKFGVIGAAVGTSIGNLVWILLLYRAVLKEMGVNTFMSFPMRLKGGAVNGVG